MQGYKVVTAEEMARIEALAYKEGASDAEFMENAGSAVADLVESYLLAHNLEKKVTVLAGKGNNGGDAFVAARYLREKNYAVTVFAIYSRDACSPLCQKQFGQFQASGGEIQTGSLSFPSQGIILDGLVGTGFKGKPDEKLAAAIQAANNAKLPIIAIDIPSGVNGNTGAVEGEAIKATMTIYLGLPKWGFFVGEGWNHVGDLIHADFGMDSKFLENAQIKAELIDEKKLFSSMPPIIRNRHKYQKGYVLSIAGSYEMAGAAILSSYASLRGGAGIVRLFHPNGIEEAFARSPLEVIRESWDYSNFARISAESRRAKAMLIGPGLGRTRDVEKMIKKLLPLVSVPCVIDADALFFLSRHHSWKLPEKTILTPHMKEMERLLDHPLEHDLCQKYAEDKNATVLLKGGPSFVFHPKTTPLIVTRGDPGLATAGTGDVLTGVVAAFLAQGFEPRDAAAMGAILHGIAGEIAAFQKSSYAMVASDVIESLPDAFFEVLNA